MLLLLVMPAVSGCDQGAALNNVVRDATDDYRFNLFVWEVNTLSEELNQIHRYDETSLDSKLVLEYFTASRELAILEVQIRSARAGSANDDNLTELKSECDAIIEFREQNSETVERIIERQIRDTLSSEGIYSPFGNLLGAETGFPPFNFELEELPRLLVISPREYISSIREVLIIPEISLREMESIEADVDTADVSSVVLEIGGVATYPSLVKDNASLSFTLNAAAEEWLHQYLAFTPLGFRYVLDASGIVQNYEIATMNETLVGIVSKEIGALVLKEYYPDYQQANGNSSGSGFDFNAEMRDIRRTVDNMLANGEIEAAEAFMEERRLYLLEQGYYIRKLNQAYFAFNGTYADSPTSVNPIGEEFAALREQSTSVRDFLEKAAAFTSRADLIQQLN